VAVRRRGHEQFEDLVTPVVGDEGIQPVREVGRHRVGVVDDDDGWLVQGELGEGRAA
jgi:hypothetical protein